MEVFLFGNEALVLDSLPLRVLPELRERIPQHTFTVLDPNEEWDVPELMVIVDTVVGIAEPQVFTGLHVFERAPRMTCHDFDAYANLLLLKKLGKLKRVTIFGLPPNYTEQEAFVWLQKKLVDGALV